MPRTVAVEGPLAYVDTMTTDKRLLLRDGMLPMKEPYIPIIQWAENSCRSVTRGRLERVELWGNILWGYGMAEVLGGPRMFVSIGVNGTSKLIDETLIYSEWYPYSAVVHTQQSSPWEQPIYLEGSSAEAG